MNARTILLALALSSSLLPLAQAKKVVVTKPKMPAAMRKTAKKQAKSRSKVVSKSVKNRIPKRKPVKH